MKFESYLESTNMETLTTKKIRTRQIKSGQVQGYAKVHQLTFEVS